MKTLIFGVLAAVSIATAFGGNRTIQIVKEAPICTSDSETTAKSLPRGVRYSCVDESTQTLGMHVCPAHFALAGASNTNNTFLCTYVGELRNQYVSTGSNPGEQVRMGNYKSLACKDGFVALGMNILEIRMYCGEIVHETKPDPASFRQVTTKADIVACPATVDPYSLSVVKGWNQSYSTMICQSTDPAAPLASSTHPITKK